MPSAAVNGIDIYYERRGDGPALLFFNGSGATLANAALLLDPFAEHFDVLAHDQRGLGRTSIPPGPYEMSDYAADAAGLLDVVGWDACRVVGISFGGMVAQEFAVTFPERVERLALICTSPGGTHASFPLHELEEKSSEELGALGATLLDTRFTPEHLAEHEGDRMLAEFVTQRQANPASGEVRRGALAQLDARSRHDCIDRLPRITCPTFVGSGRYDGIAPVDNGEAIAAGVPGAELHVYEGGHLFFVQDPTAMPDILEFLAS